MACWKEASKGHVRQAPLGAWDHNQREGEIMKVTVEHFRYLDDLRESGETNMFGARPYLAEEFGLDKTFSGAVLSAWMDTFDPGLTPEQRIEKLKAAA